MLENVYSSAKKVEENDYKLSKRDISNSSRNSSSSKFLKRKQDPKKIPMGLASKKKRQNSICDYFEKEIQFDMGLQTSSITDHHFDEQKYIHSHHQITNNGNQKSKEMLSSARSENNLNMKKKELGFIINSVYGDGKKEVIQSKEGKDVQKVKKDRQRLECDNIVSPNRHNSKKSRTQFFNYENLHILNLDNDMLKMQEANQNTSTRQNGDSKSSINIKEENQSLSKKNRWLQEQIQLYMERQYIFQTEKKHLQEIIKEKDKIIDRLKREKSLLTMKGKSQIDKEVEKNKEQIVAIAFKLGQQQQRNSHLKEENDFLQNQLILKNQQLIMVYDKYTQLQVKYTKQQKQMNKKFQKMKIEIEKFKQSTKTIKFDFNPLTQLQVWRQKALKYQEQMKYLKIQNQCLLISKDDLFKKQNQNRKLKDERDYFKQKVMDNIKRRNKNQRMDLSHSQNSSIVLELSQMSIEH